MPTKAFGHPHNVHSLGGTRFLLFDNEHRCSVSTRKRYSRFMELEVDPGAQNVTLIWTGMTSLLPFVDVRTCRRATVLTKMCVARGGKTPAPNAQGIRHNYTCMQGGDRSAVWGELAGGQPTDDWHQT